MTLEEEIAVIEQCRKMIYDYRAYHQNEEERIGLERAIYLLRRKRKRLEEKLKRKKQ